MRLASNILVLATLLLAGTAHAIPSTVALTGKLSHNDGSPVAGTLIAVFTLYDAAAAGNQVWTEVRPSLAASEGGLVFVDLGAVTPFDPDVFDGGDRWLEINVGGETLSPRLRLHAVPYALRSGDAETVGGLTPAELVDFTVAQRRVTGTCAAGSSIATVGADGSVACETDDVGVATIAVAPGLTNAGTATDVLLAPDPSVLQHRVTGACGPAASIASITATGAVTCEPDNDSGGDITSVAAGTGLAGGGTTGAVTVSADTGYLQRRVTTDCPTGMRSISATGVATCTSTTVLDTCAWQYATELAISGGASLSVTCPANTHPITGGCEEEFGRVEQSRPSGSPSSGVAGSSVNGWYCGFSGTTIGNNEAWALCCSF